MKNKLEEKLTNKRWDIVFFATPALVVVGRPFLSRRERGLGGIWIDVAMILASSCIVVYG